MFISIEVFAVIVLFAGVGEVKLMPGVIALTVKILVSVQFSFPEISFAHPE